ncbi:hypothetical protein CWO91_20600 [Bradyrhizobium genosp. SA-3]|uniref:hypothetical protein n=1 Tax=Bradyrhizobium genosp. SA-3 TaxID=508868 RepID=UPI001029BEF0|nr:hypothetical protein [Bradyrhizobium genosp. SA-3]RZN08882.1 hypothetical protein CWO91_20600 [Bradyrhizobium genosp. SA-3]
MASIRQIEANRSNAKRSTGPKTVPGKAKSSRNALRHGLARTCKRDDPEFATLMVAIRSGLACEIGSETAAAVAQANCDLWRVRLVRQAMLATLGDESVGDVARRLEGLERYERSALAAQKRALRSLRSLRM